MRHILIRIEELETLTDRELDELEARLRCILQNCPDLTEAERDWISACLANVVAANRCFHRSHNTHLTTT